MRDALTKMFKSQDNDYELKRFSLQSSVSSRKFYGKPIA